MDKWETVEYASKLPGHFHPDSCAMLYDHAFEVGKRNGLIVEIGVLYGRSASCLLGAVEGTKATVVLIDTWEGHHEPCSAHIGKLVEKFPDVRTIIMHMSSHAAAWYITDLVDLLHVDGNHQGEGIREDCELWLPKLPCGGVAAFHDYAAGPFPSIKQQVDLHTKGWEELGGADTLIFRRKR